MNYRTRPFTARICRFPILGMLAAACFQSLELSAAEVPSEPWSKPDPAALKNWQDMRFGLFINWGPVSISGQRIG